VEGFANPERVCNRCSAAGDQVSQQISNVLMITDSVAELKGHAYLRQLRFEAHVEATTEPGGFTCILSFAPENMQIDEFKMRNLRAFGITEARTLQDFEWLRAQLVMRLKPRHKIVPPLFPLKNKKSRAEQLQVFLNVVLKHIVLHDDPIFQLFITSKKKYIHELCSDPGVQKDPTAWRRVGMLQPQVQVMSFLDFDGESWYRFQIERHCCERIANQLELRKSRQMARLEQHAKRLKIQARRTENYQNRQDTFKKRLQAFTQRTRDRAARIKREQDRKDKQRATDKLVYIERKLDDETRVVVAKEVKKEREGYDVDVKDHEVAVKDQKSHLDNLVSVQTEWALDKQEFPNPVHKWLLEHMQAEIPKATVDRQHPELVRKVMTLRDEIPGLCSAEKERLSELKTKYEHESDLVVDEKDVLAREDDPIAKEKKNWDMEYAQIKHEQGLIDSERANRKKKEEVVSADVTQQEHLIESRMKRQKGRLEAQTQRQEDQTARKRQHETQIAEEKKRAVEQKKWLQQLEEAIDLEGQRLKRQREETHVLRFDHSQTETLLTSVTQGMDIHRKAVSECKAMVDEHEDILRSENRSTKRERSENDTDTERMREGQQKRTIHEFPDGSYPEEDKFAIEIHKRRLRNETSLETEHARLVEEVTRFEAEAKRLEFEGKTLLDIKNKCGAERKQVVFINELLEQLAAAVREDEKSRATKMKQYLEFCNQVVARQTERLMRYKDLHQAQQTREKATASRLQESKSSMSKLVDIDEASSQRLERADKRADTFERQLIDQRGNEDRLFFDNKKMCAERDMDAKEHASAVEAVKSINRFISSLRPAMNAGMKEKSEQVRSLQETWKATKADHNALQKFTKKYSKESVSLSGMDSIPDHDSDFAHTLRTPYELAFKQDEQESKDYFHPISNALFKEGDTFSVLRSSQDDLTVWVQKVRDSLSDEGKKRREEEEHRQAQLRLRLEKERKIVSDRTRMEREVESIANQYQAITADMKSFEQSLDATEKLQQMSSDIKKSVARAEGVEQSSLSRKSTLQSLEDSERVDKKLIEGHQSDMSRIQKLVSHYAGDGHSNGERLAKASKKMEAILATSSKLSHEATGKLESFKHDAGGGSIGTKPHAEDAWMKGEDEKVSQLKKRADHYLQKLKALKAASGECSARYKSWTNAMKQLATQEEKALDACRGVQDKLQEEQRLIATKQTEHKNWKAKHESRLESLKTKVSQSVSTCGRISAKAKNVVKNASNATLQDCMKKGEKILQSIEDGQKSVDSKSKEDVESLVDDIRLEYVNFVSSAGQEVDQGNYRLKRSATQFESLQKELHEKENISTIIKELHAMPRSPYWADQLDSLKKQANSCLETLEGIDLGDVQQSLDKLDADVKELSPLVDKVKDSYKKFKADIEANNG